MSTKRIYSDQVKVGDVVVFMGRPHRIETIEPYEHPTVPGCAGIATASDGWGIALWPTVQLEVA